MALARFVKRKKYRAVALLTAMMVCMFLLVLTGALIQTQSGVFAVAQSSDARVRSRAACQSVYDYCLYQLEHDRNWGSAGFANISAVDPARPDPGGSVPLQSRVEIKSVNGRVITGYLTEHDAGFEVEVVNALTTASTTSSSGLVTPREHVRLSIAAWEGSDLAQKNRARQQVDCLLRLAPLFDAAVLSRGDVSIQADEVVFASKDPFRNEIRSEGDVSLPGLLDGSSVFVKHNQEVTREGSNTGTMVKDKTGLLWAGGQIAQDGTALSDPQLAQAAESSGGRMVENTTNRAEIYDLKPENIPQPVPDHDIVVPPGEFRFTKAMATVRYRVQVPDNDEDGGTHPEDRVRREPIDVVEYYDPPNEPRPLKVMRAATQMASDEELIGTDISYGQDLTDIPVVTGDRFAVNQAYQDSVRVRDAEGNEIDLPEMGFKNIGTGDAPVVIDLSSQTVTVQPKTRVQPAPRPEGSDLPPSAFELTVRTGPGGDPGEPTFELGNGANDVVIQAEGDISIGRGVTDGLATFVSEQGSVTLNPKAQELRWVEKYFPGNPVPVWVLENEIEINAHPDYTGLVIYAEKDVRIANISDADWGVRGFIYARRNFLFDVNARNATFYGSVIAGNDPSEPGSFRIGQSDRTTFIYDPDYLKLLTKNLPYDWTRVEILVWTESNG